MNCQRPRSIAFVDHDIAAVMTVADIVPRDLVERLPWNLRFVVRRSAFTLDVQVHRPQVLCPMTHTISERANPAALARGRCMS